MHIADRVAMILEEAPEKIREPLLTFLRQHQNDQEPDIACLFIAIVELQDQVNSLVFENQQLRDQLTDVDTDLDKVDTRIDGFERVLFR